MDDVEETCIVELRSGSRKLEYREGFGALTLYPVLVVMCKARLGLKAWAWARLWGLRLTEISGRALVLGLGLARAWLGLGQGFARAK